MFARQATPHVAPRQARPTRAARDVTRVRNAARKFIRIFENIDKIWRFEPFDCSPRVRGRTRVRGSCAR